MVGQSQVTEPLVGALKSGKIGHAYLFVGPRGCGKTSVARILAHEVNGFKYELEDDYVDIIEIDGASNRGIDNIRELREKVMIAPTTGKYKVYIIDEVHMLTKEAFNALLKTLEEPPAHAIFIMATTDAYKVPVTITSRAQTYTFKLAGSEVMFDFLKSVVAKEKIAITDEALGIITKRGGGSFRDSLSLLDQISTLSDVEITKDMVVAALGLPQDDKISELLAEYVTGDVNKIAALLHELLNSGVKAETLAEEIISTIIATPKLELITLLAKLPEVRAPFAEARLLVALTVGAIDSVPARARISPSNATFVPEAKSPVRKTTPMTKAATNISELQSAKTPEKEKIESSSNAMNNKPASLKTATDFDWDSYLVKVRELSEAVHSQLTKTQHELSGGILHIYPGKKIVKNILSRDNNKRILLEAAGNVEITIHNEDEAPGGSEKDAVLTKISAIMGGKVENESGGDPF